MTEHWAAGLEVNEVYYVGYPSSGGLACRRARPKRLRERLRALAPAPRQNGLPDLLPHVRPALDVAGRIQRDAANRFVDSDPAEQNSCCQARLPRHASPEQRFSAAGCRVGLGPQGRRGGRARLALERP
jgi:hypothetical protein